MLNVSQGASEERCEDIGSRCVVCMHEFFDE